MKATIRTKVPKQKTQVYALDMSVSGIDPDEWDFRRVRVDQLDDAILYEYARSCAWLCKAFARWNEKKFKPSTRSKSLRRWDGLTINDLRQSDVGNDAPLELIEWFIESRPYEFDAWSLDRILEIGPRFPEPFLKTTDDTTLRLRSCRYKRSPACWEVLGRAKIPPVPWLVRSPLPSYLGKDNSVYDDASSLRTIVVDLRFSKSRIKEQLCEWVNNVDDANIKKIHFSKGKAATPPWSRLKELAAYRLSKLGMGAKQVRALALERPKTVLMPNPVDVLPNYKASGFCEAVKKAQEYIERLFSKPKTPAPNSHPSDG